MGGSRLALTISIPQDHLNVDGDLGAILVNIANPFIMNQLCPARFEDGRASELNKQIPDRGWIENACIINDGEIR